MAHLPLYVPRQIAEEKERPKFKTNRYKSGKKALVSQVKAGRDFEGLKASILQAVGLIGGFRKAIKKGDKVLLKVNFNTFDPPPASSDVKFIVAVAQLLYQFGASQVTVGDRSGYWLRTAKELERIGYLNIFQREKINFIDFDQSQWVLVKLNGECLKQAAFSAEIFNHDKIVYLPCLKTHSQARFTLSLKLTVGFMHPHDRVFYLHRGNLEAKIAELNLAVHPDLIIMDGRKCFVAGGPSQGELRKPNLILASGDRIALDATALKILLSYPADNLLNCREPFRYEQIRKAAQLGLGVKSEKEIKVIS